MNTYNTFFGFYALSNTPMWLDYEKIFRDLGSEFVNCYFVTVKNIKKML